MHILKNLRASNKSHSDVMSLVECVKDLEAIAHVVHMYE